MKYILIVGAKSDIAKEVAKEYAKSGYNLCLSGRNIEELSDFADDLKVRFNIQVKMYELDILEFSSHETFYKNIDVEIYGAVSAVGYLGDQSLAEKNLLESVKVINTNYTGIVSLFNIIASEFEKRQYGFITIIGSVAGDRGRKSNYIYGSAKAGLEAYISGLRNRLHESGVKVITVKPGFVDTKMTKGMKLPKFLTSTPSRVAKDIFQAEQKEKDILYTHWVWRLIMVVIRLIPEKIFKRLSI